MKKINFIFSFLALTILMQNQFIWAQEVKTISPSASDIKTNYVKPYVSNQKFEVIKNGKTVSTLTLKDEVKLAELNGEKYLLRVQSMPGNNFVDTSINVLKTLKPFYHSGNNKSGKLVLHFGDNVVTGKKHFAKNDSIAVVYTKMPLPYFDSNIFDLVVRYLPLTNNFKARVPTYVFEDGGLSFFDLEVKRDETIESGGKKVNAWVVDIVNNDKKLTMWVNKEDRSLIKMHSFIQQNFEIVVEKI